MWLLIGHWMTNASIGGRAKLVYRMQYEIIAPILEIKMVPVGLLCQTITFVEEHHKSYNNLVECMTKMVEWDENVNPNLNECEHKYLDKLLQMFWTEISTSSNPRVWKLCWQPSTAAWKYMSRSSPLYMTKGFVSQSCWYKAKSRRSWRWCKKQL